MGARVIEDRGLAAELEEQLAAHVAGLRDAGVVPGLATALVGSPAEALSPVPGGVGPITDVWLLKNTADTARISTRAEAARRSLKRRTRVVSSGLVQYPLNL